MRMGRKLETYLPCTPMTRQQVCVCCHAVRGCKGCCKTCKNECNSGHDCEHDINPDGMDCVWWNSIVRAMRDDMIYDSRFTTRPPKEVAGQNNEFMKVTYDIIRINGDVEVTEDVPQSDLDLIAEAEKMEWGQIACRHMEDEAKSNWARDRIHSMMVRGYRREESRCGCL